MVLRIPSCCRGREVKFSPFLPVLRKKVGSPFSNHTLTAASRIAPDGDARGPNPSAASLPPVVSPPPPLPSAPATAVVGPDAKCARGLVVVATRGGCWGGGC
jgi:hypothetical protein